MISFICIVLGTICVNLLSAEPELTVSGHVGSTAVLPCELLSKDSETLYIRWIMKSQTVFERWGSETYQGVGYEGRVDVPEDKLRKGNCSLVLRSLALSDAAVYMSYQTVRRSKRSDSVMIKKDLISRVKLSVSEKILSHEETSEKSLAQTPHATGDAGMKCPHQLIIDLSLLFSLVFQFFYKGT